MGVHLSIKAKLVLAASDGKELKFAMEEFNRACNTLSELAFQRDLHRKYDIHHQGYRLIREETDLPAQHVVNAIAKVSAVYTSRPEQVASIQTTFFRAIGRQVDDSWSGLPDRLADCLSERPHHRPVGDVARMRKQLQQGELGSADCAIARGTSTCIFRLRSRRRKLHNHREV